MKQLVSSKTGRRWGLVDTLETASVLADPQAMEVLTPFLGRSCTVGQAAKGLGARIDTMMYRVERLLAVGLIRREEGLSPRSRKVYRAVEDRFVIPFETTRFETLVDLMVRYNAEPHQRFARALVTSMRGEQGGWMVRIHRDDGGWTVDAAPQGQLDWQMTAMLAQDAPATWYTGQGLHLTREQAKALQQELWTVWQRYDALSAQAAPDALTVKHLLHLYLAPVGNGATTPPVPDR